MKKIIAIFIRDLKRISHNIVALIVTLGVCIIPSLYAWFNIAANWDPYSNTQEIAVAIANLDEGTTTDQTGHINAGDMVVEKLKENKQLDWQFVDEQQAIEGVKSSRYYAAIVLPKNFSADLASITTGHIQHPHIQYYVNEKVNAVAPKVTDRGASTIEEQINSEFVKTVTSVIADRYNAFGAKLQNEASSATDSVVSGLTATQNTLGSTQEILTNTASSFDKTQDAIAQAKSMLGSFSGNIASTQKTLNQANDFLSGARKDQATFSQQITQHMLQGSTSISAASAKANYYIGQLTAGIGAAQGELQNTVDFLQKTIDNKKLLLDDVRSFSKALGNPGALESKIAETQQAIDQQYALISTLNKAQQNIATHVDLLDKLSQNTNKAILASSEATTKATDTLTQTTLPELSAALDTVSGTTATLSASLNEIDPALQQADVVLNQMSQTIAQTKTTCNKTASSLNNIAKLIADIKQDVLTVQSSSVMEKISKALQINRTDFSTFISDPVSIKEEALFPVKNYGTGVAPFYTNLALWVGGFVLVAIYKLEVDEEDVGPYQPWQGYFGRWLLLNLLGQIQALICCIGDLVLGIQCVSPIAFVAAGLVISFVYINIIYALSIAFKHIGKALAVLLVILQIPGSSGIYPIEMMPGFFQNLYPWLPFTYGINAMRESLAGFYDGYYGANLFILCLFVIPALIIGVGLRRHLLNLNALFDRKLLETDMMISEHVSMEDVHFKLSTILRATLQNKEYSKALTEKAAQFELLYPTLIKRGFVLMFAVPIVLLIPLFISDQKLVMLILWITSIVLISAFLIIVEFIHERITEKTNLTNMDKDELMELIDKQLKHKGGDK